MGSNVGKNIIDHVWSSTHKIFDSSKKEILILLLMILLFILSLFVGRYSISPVSIMGLIVSKFIPIEHTWSPNIDTVIFQIRMPRIIAAMVVGGGLSVAGASFQGLFRNPLVSPYILGVAAGAGFGACLGILISENIILIQLLAFSFGIFAAFLAYNLGKVCNQTSTLILVLSGIIIGAVFTALTSLIKYIADPYDKLPEMVFWLMGSLSSVRWDDLFYVAPAMMVSTLVLLLIGWRINVLSLGEEEARSLGIDTKRMTLLVIICATLITTSAVSISGLIGWVGLIVPHIARMIVGPDYRKLLPMSIFLGASFLVIVDDLARTVSSTEIPLGILTALMGAPFFAYLLHNRKVGWS
ncbi:FecCD family ABC transporter permease [Methanococcoides burtonii]|uniref:Cobalamin import system permease protein BtuC n=1 Tax=Methanococcoides burtonii (strain DSM 6242 / NBRC 107633 / OCM 468 / ACE-M) TaxID=259564 RepID=Q12YJ6_METBU|nr:iron ABC transporter permease [Methanococcoides burtonii]ABE51480.1 Iron complex/Vitamin B12 ABC transporter permease protein [Methanococcoides burtonii DSM 6242]